MGVCYDYMQILLRSARNLGPPRYKVKLVPFSAYRCQSRRRFSCLPRVPWRKGIGAPRAALNTSSAEFLFLTACRASYLLLLRMPRRTELFFSLFCLLCYCFVTNVRVFVSSFTGGDPKLRRVTWITGNVSNGSKRKIKGKKKANKWVS